jgi:hypothetical protein
MWSVQIEVRNIFPQHTVEMKLAENQQVVDAFPSDTSQKRSQIALALGA